MDVAAGIVFFSASTELMSGLGEPAFTSTIVAAAMAVATANSLLILFMLMGYYRLAATESM